jgi:L-alanine-DL-glutamate epimerase-like enolase superfamily enzyme
VTSNNRVAIVTGPAREIVGPDIFLAYDCWMGLDVETAAELGHEPLTNEPAWLQECLSPDDYGGYRQLRSRLSTRVTGGGRYFGRR